MANCSNLTIVFYPLGNFGQALSIRSCHEDLILKRKGRNCAGIAFIQGDSAGNSKFIEQTLRDVIPLFAKNVPHWYCLFLFKAYSLSLYGLINQR